MPETGRRSFFRPTPDGVRLNDIWVLIATLGGTGLWRWGPGTAGSLVALPFAWAIVATGGLAALFVATLAAIAAGVPAGRHYETLSKDVDPGPVVVDELAGQWLTIILAYAIAGPTAVSMVGLVACFAAFRIFDIGKPWPCNWADRRLKGGVGIMADDLIAAVYAGIISGLFLLLFPELGLSWPL